MRSSKKTKTQTQGKEVPVIELWKIIIIMGVVWHTIIKMMNSITQKPEE